jgi:hypothetical protein
MMVQSIFKVEASEVAEKLNLSSHNSGVNNATLLAKVNA